MKLAKTSLIAFALSAALVGPVLAQGAATGGTIRGGAQERSAAPGGMTGSGDEEMNAQTGTQTGKVGAKSGAKGTVGAGADLVSIWMQAAPNSVASRIPDQDGAGRGSCQRKLPTGGAA